MRPFAALSLLAAIAGLAATSAACSSDNGNSSVTADVTITQGASAKTTTAFSPNPFTESLASQATVTWVNGDGNTHRIVSDAPLFDSNNLSGGADYVFTFTAAGTYPYHCSIHPGMVGTIIITP